MTVKLRKCTSKTASAVFHVRHGMGLIEAILLIVVVGISLAAILSTLSWASRSYLFGREDLDRRAVVFNWLETFESFFPPPNARSVSTDTELEQAAAKAYRQATDYLKGTRDASGTDVIVAGTRFILSPPAVSDGVLAFNIRLDREYGETSPVTFNRRFNRFSNEPVSDDAMEL